MHHDRLGPSPGPIRLVTKTPLGFVPVVKESLEAQLGDVFGRCFDCQHLVTDVADVCRSLNHGDVAKAAIRTQFLRLPPSDGSAVSKASPDDPERPGWPKGTPDGKGGKFRPKDSSGGGERERSRLKARRTFRSVIRRVLTTKRAVRLLGEWIGDAVLIVDEITGPMTVADDLQLAHDIAQDIADSQTAIDFAEQGPRTLEELAVSPEDLSFTSYSDFVKLDVDKYFGRAGEDMQYHHIVEQGPNAGSFTGEELNSTSNIIRLPKLIHEDVSAFYSEKAEFSAGTMTLREFLRGKSFAQQRAWGLWALKQVGVLH